MADFDLFLPLVLRFEGGFVNDPVDPGGATNKGITMGTFAGCAQRLLGVAPTLDNLEGLSDSQAGTIYRSLYWNAVRGDNIESQNLANMVCDFYVNSGTHATRMLQTTLNSLGANLTVDGAVGPSSMQALAACDQNEVYRRYKQGRIAYYQGLVQQNPSLGRFLNGWLNRVNSFPDV